MLRVERRHRALLTCAKIHAPDVLFVRIRPGIDLRVACARWCRESPPPASRSPLNLHTSRPAPRCPPPRPLPAPAHLLRRAPAARLLPVPPGARVPAVRVQAGAGGGQPAGQIRAVPLGSRHELPAGGWESWWTWAGRPCHGLLARAAVRCNRLRRGKVNAYDNLLAAASVRCITLVLLGSASPSLSQPLALACLH